MNTSIGPVTSSSRTPGKTSTLTRSGFLPDGLSFIVRLPDGLGPTSEDTIIRPAMLCRALADCRPRPCGMLLPSVVWNEASGFGASPVFSGRLPSRHGHRCGHITLGQGHRGIRQRAYAVLDVLV
ncbi:hypothetical protein GCM10010448_65460 [Streptomyces glomeratus]|uniref:Uncharacterized protein n=1 Tax=Streptomyces glomeratus TaxID=284452 RepID=A0ABP6M2Q4_9ACTN